MKSSHQKSIQNVLLQRNSFEQLWEDLKDSIFNVLFVLLDKSNQGEDQSIYGIIFQSGVDYFQMMAFPFNAAIIGVWNGGQTLESITKIFETFRISTFFPSVSFVTFLMMVYLLVAMIILVIVDIIYVSYSFSKKKFHFTWPLVILAQVVPLFVTVLFIPIIQTLFSVVTCSPSLQNPNIQVMAQFQYIKCWEGWHLFHATITLLFSSIFVFISSIVAAIMFEPRITSNSIKARKNSLGQVIFIFNKISCQFIFSFHPFDNTWFYCIMLFILSSLLYWSYNINNPYYSKQASKFFRIASTYYFWTTTMLMISQILSFSGFDGGLIIWMSGLLFIGFSIFFQKKSNIDRLFSSNLKFISGQEVQQHIQYVLLLIHNQYTDKNSYLLLLAYIEKHKEICTQDDCPFRHNNINQSQLNDIQKNYKRLIKQLERMYLQGLKKYPLCISLRLSFAFFYMQKLKNNNKAYEQFSISSTNNPSFGEQFIIYRFRKIIREKLDTQNSENSDLIEIIRLDNHISLCEEAMLISARLHKDFWVELKQQLPDLKTLNSLGFSITQIVKSIHQNYKEVKKINENFPQIIHNYSLYLILVQQDFEEGTKTLHEAIKVYNNKKLNINKQEKDIFNVDKILQSSQAIIIISLKQGQSFSNIIQSNMQFTYLTGYSTQQLIDRKIAIILPTLLEQFHYSLMKNWNKSLNQYFNTLKQSFIKQKSGYIIPIEYKLTLIEGDQCVVTFSKCYNQYQKPTCYILTDSDFLIYDVSSLAYPWFDYSSESVNSQPTYFNQCSRQQCFLQPFVIKRIINNENKNLLVTRSLANKRQIEIGTQKYKNEQNLTSIRQFFIFKIQMQQSCKTITFFQSSKQNAQKDSAIIAQINQYYDFNINQKFQQQQNLQSKKTFLFKKFINNEKIKTVRLNKNGEFITVFYDEEDESDYDFKNNEEDQSTFLIVKKLKQPSYQQKIKRAINTNIIHSQMKYLFWISVLFLALICIIVLVMHKLNQQKLPTINNYTEDILQMTKQINFIGQTLIDSLQKDVNKQHFYNLHSEHLTKQLGINLQIPYTQEDNVTRMKDLTDALIMINSRLKHYFSGYSLIGSIDLLYSNYFSICSTIEEWNKHINIDLYHNYIGFSIIILLTVCMMMFWGYILLRVQKKKIDIMIMFLDIPMPYVQFTRLNCNKFLKSYMPVNQLTGEWLKTQEKSHYFQIYREQEIQDDFQEEKKARKSFIKSHRKKILFTYLNISHIGIIWLLAFTFIIPFMQIKSNNTIIDVFQFLQPQIKFTSKQVIQINSYQLSLIMKKLQTKVISPDKLINLISSAKSKFIRTTTNNNLLNFNQQILNFKSTDISNFYANIYFKDICSIDDFKQKQNQCRLIVKGSLRGGFSTYSNYLYEITQNNDLAQMRTAHKNFINPTFLKLLDIQQDYIQNSIIKSLYYEQLMVYLFIVVSVLGLLFPWILYLRKSNTQLNETIWMLNIIPLFLLPRSKKETRDFMLWIVRQANQAQYEN